MVEQSIVAGRNAVFEALRGVRKVRRLLLASGTKENEILRKISAAAAEQAVPVERLSRRELTDRAGIPEHQGVVAVADAFPYVGIEEMVGESQSRQFPMILVLDGITDPHNYGAMLRVADGAGASGIVVAKRRSAPVTAAVTKASAGASEHVPVAQVSNLAVAFERLKRAGFWVMATQVEAAQTYFDIDLRMPMALVFGAEGKGVSRLLLERSDFRVSIPMRGAVQSLNVSVAAALVTYEARRQQEAAR